MKRITVAFPFEDVQGKLAGKQVLEYAENNNPAFDAPVGRQYARNYKSCMIACKRSATGKTYFQIKTKTATKINAASKLRMALLGGTGACRAAILTNGTYRAAVDAVYSAAKAQGKTSAKTLEKYVYDVVYAGLQAKSIMFTFAATGAQSLIIQNPWVYTNQQGGNPITIKNDILVKFWPQLATDPVVFTVSGLKAVAHDGETFEGLASNAYNVLGIVLESGSKPKLGSQYLAFTQEGVQYGAKASADIAENGAPGLATLSYDLTDSYVNPWSE